MATHVSPHHVRDQPDLSEPGEREGGNDFRLRELDPGQPHGARGPR